MWLYNLQYEDAKAHCLRSIFSFDRPSSSTFPDPSLAVTSALGNTFLPLVIRSSDSHQHDKASLSAYGHTCLFYASILRTDPDLISVLEDDSNPMIEILCFLLLHSTFAKDKLALPAANSLWADKSGIGESEFLNFQAECVELLERVCRSDDKPYNRYLCPLVISSSRSLRESQGITMQMGIMQDVFFATFFPSYHD